MKSQDHAIIFLQLLKNRESFAFNSPSLRELQQKYGDRYTVFSMDNFSDSLTTHYARTLLKESTKTVIICEAEGDEPLGALQALLNEAVKRQQQVRMFSNIKTKGLTPYLTFLKGEIFDSLEYLEF